MYTPSGLKLVDVLRTIQRETRPIDGHPDPGAIEDCWNEVFEALAKFENCWREVLKIFTDGNEK